MLSDDELRDGVTFILKLTDSLGDVSYWVETLRGQTARRWHDIYRSGRWDTLQSQAMGVFHRRVTEREAAMIQRARTRCIYIEAVVESLQESCGFICDSVQSANGISDEHSN